MRRSRSDEGSGPPRLSGSRRRPGGGHSRQAFGLSSRRWRLRRHPYVAWVLGNISQEGPLLAALPAGGALALVVVGLLLTLRALSQPGLLEA